MVKVRPTAAAGPATVRQAGYPKDDTWQEAGEMAMERMSAGMDGMRPLRNGTS